MDSTKFKERLEEHIPSTELSKYASLLTSTGNHERYNILDAVSWGMAINDVMHLPHTILKMSRNAFQAYMFRTHIPCAS